MQRYFYSVFFLLVFILGLVFAVLNAQVVPLNYYFGSKEVHFSLALILAMLLGIMLAIIVALFILLRIRRENAKLRKALQLAEKEIAELRSYPDKRNH